MQFSSNLYLLRKAKKGRCIDQGPNVEATVALKLNQGTLRQKGCNPLSGSFFGYFFGEAKLSEPRFMGLRD
jgi:hypothetical protein